MFKLGLTYTDKITGFKGVAVGHVRYLSGCNQALLAPKVGESGALVSSEWFDEQRLDVNPTAVEITLNNTETPGFDRPAPRR